MNRYRFDSTAHIHYLDSKPLMGTSTIVGVLGKNLTWWSAELSAVACLEKGEHIPTIREEYLEACNQPDKKKAIDKLQKKYPIFKQARFAHYNEKNDKAEKGVDLHAELEKWIKWNIDGRIEKIEFNEKIIPFVNWSASNVKKFLWSEAYCYSENLWTGGIADWGAILHDGTIVAGDFKSAKSAYLGHFYQVAGYVIEIEENGLLDKDGNVMGLCNPIDSVCVVPFGAKDVKPIFNTIPLAHLKEGFRACVELHKLNLAFEKE